LSALSSSRRALPPRLNHRDASGASAPSPRGDNDIRDVTDAPADLVEVGAITDAYGVRGEIRIEPFNAPHQSVLLKIRSWWLQRPAGLRADAQVTRVAMLRCRPHGSVLLASLESIADRDAALTLKGARVCVQRADFPAPASGEIYWVDLIGCAVSNTRSESLGAVTSLDDHGAHPILAVRDEAGHERLIPYVPVYVVSVDVSQRRIVVDWELDY
jgi:16S rRNA processing protein RimM